MASDRQELNKKKRRFKTARVILVSIIFISIAVLLAVVIKIFFIEREGRVAEPVTVVAPYAPTIEVIDEDAGISGGYISSRIKEYIGQAEADFRDLGYSPTKAVLPTGAIREVRFYLEGYTGFIKMTIDRGTAVSVEDTDRMIRYLKNSGIADFAYIDVRIEGKAYWK